MFQSVENVLKYFLAFLIWTTNASPEPSVAYAAAEGIEPVSFINKCHINDNKCILKSTQDAIPIFAAGIPELGISVLDPIYFEKIDGSSTNMKFVINDVHLKGLKGCIAKKIELQSVKSSSKKLIIKAMCNVEMNAQYDLKGQLIVPIEGKGDASAFINDTVFGVDCVFNDKTGKDGKKYLNLKSYSYTHEFRPNAKIHFDNLFPDNKILAQAARDVIENNPDLVLNELGPPIFKSIIEVLMKNVVNFIGKVPYEDLVILD